MKKIILASLLAFTLVATGSAMAWNIDVFASVDDGATVDVIAETPIVPTADGAYWIGATAGTTGGELTIQGGSSSDALITHVDSTGDFYATQTLGVAGCCIDCATEPCKECPDYTYTATSGAAVSGDGHIIVASGAHYDHPGPHDNVNGQHLVVVGEGDFTAGMASSLWVEGEGTTSHAMGAFGENVGFIAAGGIGMDADNCGEKGAFVTMMCFHDEGCEGQECPC